MFHKVFKSSLNPEKSSLRTIDCQDFLNLRNLGLVIFVFVYPSFSSASGFHLCNCLTLLVVKSFNT